MCNALVTGLICTSSRHARFELSRHSGQVEFSFFTHRTRFALHSRGSYTEKADAKWRHVTDVIPCEAFHQGIVTISPVPVAVARLPAEPFWNLHSVESHWWQCIFSPSILLLIPTLLQMNPALCGQFESASIIYLILRHSLAWSVDLLILRFHDLVDQERPKEFRD